MAIPEALHGFPGVTHGGAVAALFYRVTLPRPPVRLRLELPRGVPVATPLTLVTGSAGREARLTLRQGERRLAEAAISRDPEPESGPGASARPEAGEREGGGPAGSREVPRTTTCLACGPANPLGVNVRFRFDPARVFSWYEPTPPYEGRHGLAHPALAAILLDELGWWLGALHQGEAGVTTELDLVIWRDLPWGPLHALGDRATVAATEDPRGRHVRATGAILSPGGDLLATGTVRFAGSPAYTRRLLGPFLAVTAPEALREVFPRAVEALRAP